MTTSIALGGTGTGLMSREDLAKSLNNASMAMPTVGGDKQYIKMLTKGRDAGTWVYGQQETEVEGASLWAINPHSIKHGFVAWDTNGGGAPVQELMLSINRQLPSKDTLPELPMGTPDKNGRAEILTYQDQRSFDAVCISGEDEGTVVEYKQSSVGAMKLFGKIINGLLTQVEKGEEIVPVGKWSFSTYKHTKYGEIYNPEFEIVEWRTPADTSPPEVKEEAKAEEPVRERRTRAPAAEAKAEDKTADAEADEEDAKLAAEYAATQAEEAAPRRRQRR
jgi:hypothetical protein